MSSPSSYKENFSDWELAFQFLAIIKVKQPGQSWRNELEREILQMNFKKVYSSILCSIYGSFDARRHKFWNPATLKPTCKDSPANYHASSKQSAAVEKGESETNRHLTFPSPVFLLFPISNHDCPACFATSQALECVPRKSCLCTEKYPCISAKNCHRYGHEREAVSFNDHT